MHFMTNNMESDFEFRLYFLRAHALCFALLCFALLFGSISALD